MKRKTITKGLSAALVLVLVFVSYIATPAKAYAEEAALTEAIEEYSDANDFSQDPALAYSPLIGEWTDGRDESVKVFRRADGAKEAVVYSDPIHYRNGEAWETIDNTLEPVVRKDGTQAYRNKANDFVVSFSPVFNADRLVTVESKGYALSWRFAEEALIAEGTQYDTLPITDAQAEVAVRETPAPKTDAERDMQLRFPEELTSEIAYTDPAAGLNVRYILSGKRLTEQIILDHAPQNAIAYTALLTANGLKANEKDGLIVFADEAGEVIFRIMPPFMYDANGADSDEIEVRLTETEDGYAYTLIPSEEWLNDEARAYPITIDPDVQPLFAGSVQDTYINYQSQNSNYSSRDRLKIGGTGHFRSLIRITGLPALETGDVVVESTLNLSRYNTSVEYNKEIDLYRIKTEWSYNTVTWNSFQPDSTESVERNRVSAVAATTVQDQFNQFDITRLVKLWYETPSENYGLILESWKESSNWYTEYRSSDYNSSYSGHPYFSIIYVNSTGLEDRFSYYSQSAGRAGTGSVNVYTGNLTWVHADASISNGPLPIALSHVYNTNDRTENIGYGFGWRLNYAQSLEKVSLPHRTGTSTYYQWIDGDGTRHYYKYSSANTYVNELDKDSTLTISGTTVTIEDKGGNKLTFACNSGAKKGRLTTIEDANGNRTLITYATSTITDLRISSIQEQLDGQPAGQALLLTYTDDLLSSVTAPDGLDVTYSYTSSDLCGISYTDGKTCTFTYSAHCMTQVKNIDLYNLNYTYNAVAPYKVMTVTEKADTVAGQNLTFKYGWNCTSIWDTQLRKTVYQFNNGGQAVSVRDGDGRAVYAAYNTAEQTVTQLSAVSKLQSTIFNLLYNHGFERTTYWTRSNTTNAAFSMDYVHEGKYSLKMVSTSSASISATQAVTLTAGQTYTFSVYCTGRSGVKLYAYNGSTEIAHSDPVETVGTTGTDWMRGVLTFTVPDGVSAVTVKIELPNTCPGTVYVDSAQLEAGSVPNRYNMLENGDFSNGIARWTESANIDASTDGVKTVSHVSHPTSFSDSVYHIRGLCDCTKYLTQSISVQGKKGDTYSFGTWVCSGSVPKTVQPHGNSTRVYGVKCITLEFLNGDTVVNTARVYFSADTDAWQFACGSAVAGGAYTSVRLRLQYNYTRNNCYFDGVQLYRETFSQGYSYDAQGNLTGTKSLIGQQNSFQYDSSRNVTSSTDPKGHTTSYTYDSKHNLKTVTTPTGTKTSYTYNAKGQVLTTQIGNTTDDAYIGSTTYHYAATGLLKSVTDARGNTAYYTYDGTTRRTTLVTDPKGNTGSYLYGNAAAMLRLASLTSTGLGTVEYSYDEYGKLTKIKRGSTEYNLTYNDWSQPLSTKVGTTALSTNTYDGLQRLSAVTYANGFSARYVYDSLDRVTKIYQPEGGYDTLTYEMIYNGEGELYELRNFRTQRACFFDYDHAGRCMECVERSFACTYEIVYDEDNHPLYKEYTVTSYTAILSAYKYQYDVCNNLTKLTCTAAGSTWSTVYTYDNDNRPKTTTLPNGTVLTNTYDRLGRIGSKKIGLGTDYITALTYHAGAETDETTALVATYQNGSDAAYAYDYDENGNITAITQGTTSITYEYDAANRLTRENNQVTSQTVTYEYDVWGNILNKKLYAYTTSDLTNLTYTQIDYAYTNTAWGDQLTSYDNTAITYDAMGNPLNYQGYAFTWRGKQLIAASNGTDILTFEYNEDGLRQKKSVNNVDTDYFYNGSVLIGMQKNTDVLRFSYNASGSVVSVNYNGTEYYYLRNAQGDIVKIIDGSGSTVVTYTYDTWGKEVQITGSLAGTLGSLQPFRYRGYVYDEETGLYYLQSRYYDPTAGRFISADILLSTGQGVLGHNAYAYCLDNPVNMVDDGGSASRDLTQLTAEGKNGYSAPDNWYETIEGAVVVWAVHNIMLTQKDHKERGGIIVSQKDFLGRKHYSVKTTGTGTGINGTCWMLFANEYTVYGLNPRYTIEGFVHTHTAYPPETYGADKWLTGDLGPSTRKDGFFNDLLLFSFLGIDRQFIANERGAIYEFDSSGNMIKELKPTYTGSPAIIKSLLND